ncbi:MAG: hypothetical protein JSW14_00630 [Candidatus Bathyarchaeum sp.]|nr:MAG: hypothetical protein JSW14_00630 [Candidatus Bathyarchaeum sp.]
MMRTVEVLFVIIIILGAFIIATQFAVLPSPRQSFGTNLRELSQSTLETLDGKGVLTETVFKGSSDPAWGDLKMALSASLPPNVVYNLSVYDISASAGGAITYQLANSISDAGFGAESDSASFMVTSPNVTFTEDPQKVGESTGQNITLYILNCNDANGWWITGYTGQSLASDFKDLLSPYFTSTILINSTYQLRLLLENSTSLEGTIQNAVVVNTFGEAVPIPADYCQGGSQQNEGYEGGSYAKFCYTLGSKTQQYNWTWVSIVGYPVYYVSNTEVFTDPDDHNGYGIHGMIQVGPAGLNAFLRGLDGDPYVISGTGITGSPGDVTFNSEALENLNYYGIYPDITQTATRALPDSILTDYQLTATELFIRQPSYPNYIPAATYKHTGGGVLTAIGLTRIPDIRVAALALLMYYRPTVYRSEFGASGTSRLVTLQLGQQGGT